MCVLFRHAGRGDSRGSDFRLAPIFFSSRREPRYFTSNRRPQNFFPLFRKIAAIMRAAALLPPQRSARDPAPPLRAYCAVRSSAAWLLPPFPDRPVQPVNRRLKTAAIPADAAILPRQFPQFGFGRCGRKHRRGNSSPSTTSPASRVIGVPPATRTQPPPAANCLPAGLRDGRPHATSPAA